RRPLAIGGKRYRFQEIDGAIEVALDRRRARREIQMLDISEDVVDGTVNRYLVQRDALRHRVSGCGVEPRENRRRFSYSERRRPPTRGAWPPRSPTPIPRAPP